VVLTDENATTLKLAKLCQTAEHEYTGTRLITDQFIASFVGSGNALMFDRRSLEYPLLSVPPHLRMVICNSMVRHELASGEYNRRRTDCETGGKLLAPYLPEARALGDVEIADLEEHKHVLPRTVYRCCRHVGSENQRVFAAAKELQSQGRPVWSFDVPVPRQPARRLRGELQ
jgi:galactokinase